jgi:DNA-directed RNA polymerase subunit omega
MARVTVEDCLKNVDNRFALVHLAVRRVLQLRHGAPAVLENVKSNKEVVLALREIASNRINAENIGRIEEPVPVAAEPALPEAEIARAEIRDILEEATSYGPAIELEGTDRLFEEDQPPEGPQEES